MKTSIWDILTGIILLGILCMIGGFGAILVNPAVAFNPFRPGESGAVMVPTIAIPTDTPAPPSMPPTWTPSPLPQQGQAPSITVTLRPSSTPVPTNTIVVLPTFTATRRGAFHGSSSGVSAGGCTIVFQDPKDDTDFSPQEDFNMRWTIKNNSGETWRQDSVDVNFTSGTAMHIGADRLDLPYDVSTGGMVDITMSMEAPNSFGEFTANWALQEGNRTLCRFYIAINVR